MWDSGVLAALHHKNTWKLISAEQHQTDERSVSCVNSLKSASGCSEDGKAEDREVHPPAVHRFIMSSYREDKRHTPLIDTEQTQVT